MLYSNEIQTRQRRSGVPVRPRTEWEKRARRALDRWSPDLQTSVAAEIESSFRDGIRHAAKLLDARGEKLLAIDLQRAADEGTRR